MTSVPRRLAAALASAAALAACAAPAAFAADHTQQMNLGAELVRQPPGKPWVVNLELGSDMGMTDGSVPSPVDHMVFSFTKGAKVHPEAFGTCTTAILAQKGPEACPANSRLGTGTAIAETLGLQFHADVTVFNSTAKGSARTLIVYARVQELKSVVVILPGTLKTTSGKFGYVLDLPVPPIKTVGEGNDASITHFDVKVGGFGKVKGKRVPFIEAPTSCTGPGWPFLATYHYADGASGSSASHISCVIKAVND